MTQDLDLAIDEFEAFAENLKAEIKRREQPNPRLSTNSGSPTECAVKNLDTLLAEIEHFSEHRRHSKTSSTRNSEVLLQSPPSGIRPHSMWDEGMERDLDDLTQRMINSFKGVDEEPLTSNTELGSCSGCGKVIQDKSVIADGKKFHQDCFKCSVCQTRLLEKYYIVDTIYYCEDHKKEGLPKCTSCGDKIEGTVITSKQKKYHASCFKCNQCSQTLDGKYYTTQDGQNLCEKDYKNSRDKCSHCTLPILDQILTALDKKFHPDCFRCALCDIQLDGVPFVQDGMSINCRECYVRFKADQCFACSKGIVSSVTEKTAKITCEGRNYHEECFTCISCGCGLADQGFRSVRNSVFCADCSTPAKIKLVYNNNNKKQVIT